MRVLPQLGENNSSNPHQQIYLYWVINVHTSSATSLQSMLLLVGHMLQEKQVVGSHGS